MISRYSFVTTNLALALLSTALLGSALVGCGAATRDPTDTNTNWLAACEEDADCDPGLSCLCNACTVACDADEQCSAQPGLTCAPVAVQCGQMPDTCQRQSEPDEDATAVPSDSTATTTNAPSDPPADTTSSPSPISTQGWSTALSNYTYDREQYYDVAIAGGDVWVYGAPVVETVNPGPQPAILLCPQDRSADIILRRQSDDGFAVQEHPIALSTSALHASDENNLWAVGLDGMTAHFDGTQWQMYTEAVVAAAGVDATDLCHEVSLSAVFTLSPTDTWVVGYVYPSDDGPGLVLHFDGETWERQSTGAPDGFFAVWASSPNNAWAAGSSGLMYHYDGVSWSQVESSTPDYINSMVGAAPDDIWALSSGLLHFDGTSWSNVEDPDADVSQVWAIAVGADHELWALRKGTYQGAESQSLSRWNGMGWVDVETTTDASVFASSLAVSKSGEVWGAGGNILRFR